MTTPPRALWTLVLVVAACDLKPYSETSALAPDTTTGSTSTATTDLTTGTTAADTTTGGPIEGTWRGVLQVPGWTLTFADCPSGEVWNVHSTALPPVCGALYGSGLYVEVHGILYPSGAPDVPADLDIAEILLGPCAQWICDTGGTSCGAWEDLCGDFQGCDVFAQDCPEDQKCMPFSNDGSTAPGALKCVPVMPGAGGPGDPCTVEGNGVSGLDSCEEGAMCWDIDPQTGIGACIELCSGSYDMPHCDQPATACHIYANKILAFCLPTCDPLAQDCPDAGLCLVNPMSTGFECVLDASGAEGQLFDPCEYANACDPGLFCADPALAVECDPQLAGCCLPFCDLSSPTCTAEGAVCLPWYEPGMAPPSFENVGVCGLPQ